MTLPFPLRAALLCAGLLASALAAPRAAAAQVPDSTAAGDTIYEVRLADGSVLYGRVVRDEGARLTVLTQAGATVQVERALITRMEPVRRPPPADPRGWTPDPNTSRLFFGPTARAVGAGEGYLGVYEVFFPFLTVGISDNFTLSAGTPIIPEVVGELYYFAPKLTVMETERAALATGAFIAGFDGETAGVVYGVGTLGTPDRALTGAVGWAFSDGDFHNQAIIMVGGEARTGRSTKFISESYIAPGESDAVVSAGLRFFGERLSADFGVGFIPGEDGWLPLVNFVYRF